jgi:hypothetical protein
MPNQSAHLVLTSFPSFGTLAIDPFLLSMGLQADDKHVSWCGVHDDSPAAPALDPHPLSAGPLQHVKDLLAAAPHGKKFETLAGQFFCICLFLCSKLHQGFRGELLAQSVRWSPSFTRLCPQHGNTKDRKFNQTPCRRSQDRGTARGQRQGSVRPPSRPNRVSVRRVGQSGIPIPSRAAKRKLARRQPQGE